MGRRKILLKSIGLLAAAMVLFFTAGNVFAGSISDARQEKQELENQLKEAQELIDKLSSSQENVEDKIAQLDEKLTEIAEQITALEIQLEEKESQITDTRQELLDAQADVEQQYESMKLRIRFMYENSTQSYLEALLSSESVGDFLNRAEYIYQISQYDRSMLEKYKETVASVEQLETTLETERQELAELKQQVQQEQDAVAVLLNEKENQLAQIGEEITDAQQLASAYEAEIEAQNEIIAMIQAEEARKKQEEEAKRQEEEKRREEESENGETAEGGTEGEPEEEPEEPEEEPEEPSYSGGAFTWPCPSSTRVTSDYGPRESPTGGASTYHRGIDIGAAHGADIVAAADGTVSFTGYSSSAGNYLTVSHGNGVYTVYMHCSSIVASKGDSVNAGQVIAKVGSTGISTGNHLHFGVTVNGSYVSPWDYLQ